MTDVVNETKVSNNVNRVNQNENITQGKFDSVKKAIQNCFHKCLISKLSFREMTNNFKSKEFFFLLYYLILYSQYFCLNHRRRKERMDSILRRCDS